MNSLGGNPGSRERSPATRSPPVGFDPGRSSTQAMLDASCLESLIDDATQIIQRAPYICRAPKRLWSIGLASELADAVDRLNVKIAELQGADR